MNSYTQLINRHKGENAFIFGAGPSLWEAMQHRFFKEIPKYGITMAVNSAVMAVPNFDYWVSNDVLCRKWSWWKDVVSGKGIKVVRNSWEKYKDELKDFLFYNPRPTPEDVIQPEDMGLAYCSSIPTSIDLAIQMGCKQIFLLGVDQNSHEGKHHFWQFMSKDKQPVCNPNVQDSWGRQRKVFDITLQAFKALNGFAFYKNVNIYNCSDISTVDIFNKIELSEIGENCDKYR